MLICGIEIIDAERVLTMPGVHADNPILHPHDETRYQHPASVNNGHSMVNGGFVHRYAPLHTESYEHECMLDQIDSRREQDSLIFEDDKNVVRWFFCLWAT